MVEPPGATLNALIAKAQAALEDVRLIRRDERPSRALVDLEGRWGVYRIICLKFAWLTGVSATHTTF